MGRDLRHPLEAQVSRLIPREDEAVALKVEWRGQFCEMVIEFCWLILLLIV
jgi:hypothetical protein